MFIPRPHIYASGQRRPLYGVGINDATYPVSYKDEDGVIQKCPHYYVWASMVERCFSPKLHERRPTYKDCTLESTWKLFSVFKHWMIHQDWEGKALDKDLLVQGNKHYGPETCVFIPRELNNLLTLRGNGRGPYPLGVSTTTCKGHTYFVASCSFYGTQKRLGYFKTIGEAAEAYKNAKLAYIAELAQQQTDLRIKTSLLNIY